MRTVVFAVIGINVLTLSRSFGQPAASPEFDVASVKPTKPEVREIGGFYTFPGGRIKTTACTLKLLIEVAFSVQSFQISGGPGWMNDDRWDIEAKPPASSKSSKANPAYPKVPPNEEQRQMLQALLADRFQLKLHRQAREGSVYLLVKGNKELKLQAAKDEDVFPWAGGIGGGGISGDGIAGTNASMQILASRLSPALGRPVLDETGLKGSFDFKFEYPSTDPRPDVISAILTSVQGLGLKLEAAKGPVQTLVIDRVEKPSGN
jgi:uncharacterized protein (TIGR03435 family)